jgi:hypothetical protein
MSAEPVTVPSTLLGALRIAHSVMEATMAEVTDELANLPAPGRANSIGSAYAHAILAEDGFVQAVLQGRSPLFATAWSSRTGTDRPMPISGVVEGRLEDWYPSVVVDVAACRAYAQAVYGASEAFLEEADDEVMNRPMDMSSAGFGTLPLATVFGVFVIGHLNNLTGEVSAVKGINGLKGYPF